MLQKKAKPKYQQVLRLFSNFIHNFWFLILKNMYTFNDPVGNSCCWSKLDIVHAD